MSILVFELQNSQDESEVCKIPFKTNIIKIGRQPKDVSKINTDPEVTFVYLQNQSISSSHCTITIDHGNNVITVLDDSRNGTVIQADGQDLQINKEEKQMQFPDDKTLILKIKSKDVDYKVVIELEENIQEKVIEKKTPQRPKKEKNTDEAPKEKQTKRKSKQAEQTVEAEQEAKQEIIEKRQPKEKQQKKEKTAKPQKIQKIQKKQKEENNNEEIQLNEQNEDLNDKQISEENSDSSEVKNMIKSDVDESSESDSQKICDKAKKYDPEEDLNMEACNIATEFDPKNFLKQEIVNEVLNDDQARNNEENEAVVDIDQFKKQYKTIIFPQLQEKYDFDTRRQIKYFDLYKADVWASELTDKQLETLERFQATVHHDYNPLKIKYYIAPRLRRTNRCLIALISGVLMIDSSTLDDQLNIEKSFTLDYYKLRCNMLLASKQTINELIKDDKLIDKYYINYSIPFLTAFFQEQKMTTSYTHIIVGAFTFNFKNNVINNQDDLDTMLGFCYFLNQLGVIAVVVNNKDEDHIFKSHMTKTQMYKSGIIRSLVGSTIQERFNSIYEKLQEVTNKDKVAMISVQEEFGFDCADLIIEDKEDFIRSAFIGFMVRKQE